MINKKKECPTELALARSSLRGANRQVTSQEKNKSKHLKNKKRVFLCKYWILYQNEGLNNKYIAKNAEN